MTHSTKVAGWVRFKRKSGSILLDNQHGDGIIRHPHYFLQALCYKALTPIFNQVIKSLRFFQ